MSLTSRYLNLSLSGKLLLPLLSATLAIWGIGGLSVGYVQSSKIEQDIRNRMIEFSSQVEQNFDQRVNLLELKARSVVETTVISEAVATRDRLQLLQVLLPLQTSLELDLMKMIDEKGEVLLDLRGDSLSGLDLQIEDLERTAINGLSFTTVRYDPKSNAAILVSLISSKTAEGIVGGAFLGIALDEALLANLQADSQRQQLVLVYDSATILTTHPDLKNADWSVSSARDSISQVSIQNSRYLATEVDLSGAIESNVKLFVLRGTDDIAETKQQFWLLTGAFGMLGAALTSGVGIWVTRLVTRRVTALIQATENLAKGDFNTPVHVGGQDEVSRLAVGFNAMAEQVNERERTIRAHMTQLTQALQELEETKDKLVFQERRYSQTLEEKVSELQLTKRKLENSGHTLEAQVKSRTQELSNTLQELQETQSQLIQTEKMSSLGQMVAGIAHEINNPINFIQGNIRPLREYFEDLSEFIITFQAEHPNPTIAVAKAQEDLDIGFVLEDGARILKSMEIGTKRVRDIVVSLRNYSRLDEASIKSVDIHEGIEGTLMILNHRLKQGIEVIKNYGSLPKVTCSPAQLNQVYTNIIVNAIDALFEADVQPKQLTISTQVIYSEDVQISIRDNGVGIPDSIKNRIFDPFFTTKSVGKGTGLGLGICYKIIQQHEGMLEVSSEVGRGTEFVITLPKEVSPSQPV